MLSRTKLWLAQIARLGEAVHQAPKPWPEPFTRRLREACRISATSTRVPGNERRLSDAIDLAVKLLPAAAREQVEANWKARLYRLEKEFL